MGLMTGLGFVDRDPAAAAPFPFDAAAFLPFFAALSAAWDSDGLLGEALKASASCACLIVMGPIGNSGIGIPLTGTLWTNPVGILAECPRLSIEAGVMGSILGLGWLDEDMLFVSPCWN